MNVNFHVCFIYMILEINMHLSRLGNKHNDPHDDSMLQ